LRTEYDRRRKQNRRYSLRSFSRFLGVPSGRVSEILNFKRPISIKLGERLAEKLYPTPLQRQEFLDSVRRHQDGLRAFKRLPAPDGAGRQPEYSLLTADQFSVVADWYHFAILSLVKTVDFQRDPVWIANRLGIPKSRAKEAFARLLRLGLIRQNEDGRWAQTQGQLTTTPEQNAEAIRRSHSQKLRMAMRALHEVPVEQRDISSMTMAIDRSKVPLAKQLLKNYRRRLCELMEEGTPNEVYQLTLAFIPVTKE